MASVVPAGQLDLSPRWVAEDSARPTEMSISGWTTSRRDVALPA